MSASGPTLVRVWVQAARPKTLYAAVAPVLVGTAVAYAEGGFRPLPALAALFSAIMIQIGTNLANDAADFQKGADTGERLGPLRVTQAGLLAPRQVIAGALLSFGAAALAGLYLFSVAGWPVLALGLFSILAGVGYTAGPFPLGYLALGDLFVFLFFGLTAVAGTAFVQTGQFTALALWAAIPAGLLATAILVVNNLRDLNTDRKAGKITLAVRLGDRRTRWEYAALVAGAYLAPLAMWWAGMASAWVLLTLISAPRAWRITRALWGAQGQELNRFLEATGQLELAHCILLGAGLILGA
jgi:1,4-dihydroxy-2-naphthoate octaprenyltransferase